MVDHRHKLRRRKAGKLEIGKPLLIAIGHVAVRSATLDLLIAATADSISKPYPTSTAAQGL
jgi:hypothetical protein